MRTVAVIQARMGSSRLPGKVMLPLAGDHVLEHVVRRIESATTVDEVVVATSTEKRDDIVQRYASRAGASVFRGSEDDVLARMFEAATEADADVVVRATADCPLASPDVIDAVVRRRAETGADYASTVMERTFPRGIGGEVFTYDSFEIVHRRSTEPYQREHVTPYFDEHPDTFDLQNVTSAAVFDEERYQDRTDLRLTLDEADDYELLRELFNNPGTEGAFDLRGIIDYIDRNDLQTRNQHVEQVTREDVTGE